MKLLKKPTKKDAYHDHVELIFCHESDVNQSLGRFFSRVIR